MAEAATLVGMLKGTSHYNPVQQPERSKARRNVVLAQTVKPGELAPAQFAALKDTPLAVRLTREAEPLGSAPHFALHARKWLAEWAQKNDHDLYQEGLTIVTTLDTRLQAAASQAVSRQAALLQQVADVEWSQPTLRVTSANIDAYAKARPKVDPFGHFWGKRRDLVTAFVRDSAEFKKLIADKVAEPDALARLLADTGFMRKLRDEKTRLEAGFVASTREAAKSRCGSAAATSSKASSITWRRPRASRARPSSPSSTARHSQPASTPTRLTLTAMCRSTWATASSGARPT